MSNRNIQLIRIMVLFMFLLSEPMYSKEMVYGDSVFTISEISKDSTIRNNKGLLSSAKINMVISKEIIERHLYLIKRIIMLAQIDTFCCKVNTTKFPYSFNIRLPESKGDTIYEGRLGSFLISKQGQIGYCFFSNTLNCSITKNKDIDSSCFVHEKRAILLAQSFFKGLLDIYKKGNEINEYDSIYLYKSDQGNFNVFLKCRLKNDILDTRQAEIDVDIATGGVLAYKGNIVNMNDFSYVPKIEKSEVIDLINNKFYQIKNGEMKIEYMFLSLSPFRDSWKWKWLISLTGRNEDGYLNGYIDVDSETGQILESNLK